MTLNKVHEFQPTSHIQAAGYASITQNAIFTLNNLANNAAAQISVGNFSSTGQITMDVYGGLTSEVSGVWSAAFASLTLTAQSTAAVAIAANTNPLFPYAKATIIAKATGSGASVFENIISKLVTD